MQITASERFTGCLLGGAIGDALGAPLEFINTLGEIRARFGHAGLTDYFPAHHRLAAITDDTQMTLFTAEGLLRADNCRRGGGACDTVAIVHRAYRRWLNTQGLHVTDSAVGDLGTGWLWTLRALHDRRAPGGTCLSALESQASGTMGSDFNDSKGCGGVMRMAPAGLVSREPFQLGCELAALTHCHPSGYLAAGFLAQVIAEVIAEVPLETAIAVATERLRTYPRHHGCLQAVQAAVRLAQDGEPTAERVPKLGAGWVAEEALAISLYCALVARDFEHGVLLAVNHAGDSDSTGSITGNILGALWGRQALPERWLEPLELRAEIEELATDLYRHFITGDAANDCEKYPPN